MNPGLGKFEEKYLDEKFKRLQDGISTTNKIVRRIEVQNNKDHDEIKATNLSQNQMLDVLSNVANQHEDRINALEKKRTNGTNGTNGNTVMSTKKKVAYGSIVVSVSSILMWFAGLLPG